VRLQLIDALISARQFEEALTLSESAATELRDSSANAEAINKSQTASWFVYRGVVALRGLGRSEEAIDLLRKASHPPGSEIADTDSTINLASLLCAVGRPQEALQVLETPLQVSPYGLMKISFVRQWAALQMNDAEAAEYELGFMREHQADDLNGFQEALIAAGRSGEAVRQEAWRLSISTLRTDALMQLQRFNRGDMPAEEKKRDLAWRAFSDRADVQAAVSGVGRIETFAIGPTQNSY
jgi:tetratricopeptide (TPR) repeat protein